MVYPRDPMWTAAGRAELASESIPYAICSNDAEWAMLVPLRLAPPRSDCPWRWTLRTMLNGILYVLRISFAWRHMPQKFWP